MERQELPIAAFRGQIVSTVRDNAVTIIEADTGAGKSTQVAQYLLAEGWNLVVTQPRRLACRSVASRVAQEIGEKLGGTVGFRTAYERSDSRDTRCLFVTDGLALVRELMGLGNHGILVLDEVHEWNLNMEVLVAWAKRQIDRGVRFKVVIMSATMEAEKLSRYFGGAPVISVPGRMYPVEDREPSRDIVTDVATLVREGRNVLVFQPGKGEIGKTVGDLNAIEGLSAEILPLHGELTSEEQDACFRRYGRPKVVVATNVAQTSVTIDDIDAVVDSGMERRIELVGGVEGLYLKPISRADARQRKGRAGRTKPGIYIDHCEAKPQERLDFPKAEILRTRLDQTVLRLADAGFDAEELAFFHQPPRDEIHAAKRALKALGCMDRDGHVTRIGKRVAQLPVSVQFARMVVEAERLGVVDDVITIAAILEQGEVTARKAKDGSDATRLWTKLCAGEIDSDIMAQLAVYRAACNMSKDEMAKNGVFIKAFYQAKEKRRHLADSLKGKIRFGSSGKRENVLRAVCAGMVDHLYHYEFGSYRNGDAGERQLARESVVKFAEWVVGIPFDIEVKTKHGPHTLRLVRMCTAVKPQWLAEVAPQLVERRVGQNPRYSPEKDGVVSTTQVIFNGQQIAEEVVDDPEHVFAAEAFASWLLEKESMDGTPLARVWQQNESRQQRARTLNQRIGLPRFRVFSRWELEERVRSGLNGARRMAEIQDANALCLPPLDECEVATAMREYPDAIELCGRRVPVEYPMNRFDQPHPRVTVGEEILIGNRFETLPDSGVHLPSGKLVEVVLTLGWHEVVETDTVRLKAKIRAHIALKEAQREYAQVMRTLETLPSRQGWHAVPRVLCTRIERHQSSLRSQDVLLEVETWVAVAKALVAEVEAALASHQEENVVTTMRGLKVDLTGLFGGAATVRVKKSA
jgi:HrpA-like RNA helicase